jgi:nitroreductase/NAD-dependent dihydropyrimidine dehydrogenase PreA subunit
MSLFVVDDEKCKRDGICAKECPLGIIEFKDDGTVPGPYPWADDLCINCGHCVAVCPYGALSHKNIKPEDCPPVKKEWQLGPDQVEHFLRSRRSIRTYKKKSVEKEKTTQLIEIASHAPSGHNLQPVNWHVVQDKTALKNLNGIVIDWMRDMLKTNPKLAKLMHLDIVIAGWEFGLDTICRDAPHVIIAHGSKEDRTAQTACVIAMTYLELAAPSFGLGGCWAGFFNFAANIWPPLIEALGLPKGHLTYGTMMIGYPTYKYYRLPPRNKARITWKG